MCIYIHHNIHIRICKYKCTCTHKSQYTYTQICIYKCTYIQITIYIYKYAYTNVHICKSRMSSPKLSVGSLKFNVSFAEYGLFYRTLLQKRTIILRSLLIVVAPYHVSVAPNCSCMYTYICMYECIMLYVYTFVYRFTYICMYICMCVYICIHIYRYTYKHI